MSMTSWNKVMLCKTEGDILPKNAVADINGDLTRDPEKATFLMPAGAHKGFGLASMVEILCGVFTGMNFGRDIPGMYTSPMENLDILASSLWLFDQMVVWNRINS